MAEELEIRVRRLERNTNGWRAVALIAVAIALSGNALTLWYVRRVPNEIRAQRFSLVDATGRETARLANADIGSALVLDAKAPNTHVVLGTSNEMTGLGVMKNGDVRINLGVGDNGSPGLSLSNTDKKQGATLGVDDADGSSYLILRGKEERSRLFAILGPKPKLRLTDASHQTLWEIPPGRESISP